ncbi:hypothetical protein [Cryptosporangium japonicum]|uniref:Transcriptional regulator, AbiEi antitoxin, Type IV TA system n=1 Tax=Cryptosporangium japonicum TaxID=80872 RepID=A0ABP3EEI3_9ACTN
MARTPHRPAELVGQIFRGSDVVRRGLLTRSQLNGAAWRRVLRDVYVDAELPDSHRLRCEAVGLILPAGAALTGRSAACVEGLPIGEPEDPVSVIVPPPNRLQMRGVRARHAALPATEIRRHPTSDPPNGPPGPGLPVTVPVRTAWELAREPDVPAAVAGLDLLLGHGYVTESELRSLVEARPRTRTAATLRLADGRAGAPEESVLRVKVVRAGFPHPVPHHPIRVHDHRTSVDLGWPALRVGANFYRDSEHYRGDQSRRSALADARWTVILAGRDELHDPDRFAKFCGFLDDALRRRRDETL